MRHLYFLLLMTIPFTGIRAQNPAEQLPEQLGAYRATEQLDYTDENLFEYINGGAEMYLSYGLVGMKGRVYTVENLPEVTVEVYEMTEAKNAFGVYTQTRDKEEHTYGQGSQSQRDAVMFWKDRYFVIINTSKVTPESTEAVRQSALLIDKAIPGIGKIPDIVDRLPEKDLAPAGFVYFHHYIWLNSYYFIADYNILDIDKNVDAVLAKYGAPEDRSYLLLAEYPDNNAARKAYTQMKQKYAPEAKTNTAVRLEDGTWFAVWIKGNKAGVVFNGSTREATEKLYRAAEKKM